MDSNWVFFIALFLVAVLYSSVGHGGASGYLALMALFSITPEVMKPTALLLNLFVSMTSFIMYYRGKHFIWKIFFPFVITSVPLSFLGGMIHMDALVYKKILGILLLIPIIRFLFFGNIEVKEIKKSVLGLSLFIGGLIGFLSGLIGIGGGIILSPILLMMKWTDQKQTAAISALFIFVNSLAGLMGQVTQGIHFNVNMYAYVGVAFLGGLCGAYLGAIRFKHAVLRNILAMVLLLAAYKLLFTGA